MTTKYFHRHLSFLLGCDNGDILLYNGTDVTDNSDSGIVLVCYNNTYGSVCDDFWDTLDAMVVCGQLNFSTEGEFYVLSGTLAEWYIHVRIYKYVTQQQILYQPMETCSHKEEIMFWIMLCAQGVRQIYYNAITMVLHTTTVTLLKVLESNVKVSALGTVD